MAHLYHDADPKGFSEYMDNSGVEVIVTGLLDASVSEAFDARIEHAWLSSGTHDDQGPSSSCRLIGRVRHAPIGIEERIVRGAPVERRQRLEGLAHRVCLLQTHQGQPVLSGARLAHHAHAHHPSAWR